MLLWIKRLSPDHIRPRSLEILLGLHGSLSAESAHEWCSNLWVGGSRAQDLLPCRRSTLLPATIDITPKVLSIPKTPTGFACSLAEARSPLQRRRQILTARVQRFTAQSKVVTKTRPPYCAMSACLEEGFRPAAKCLPWCV